MLRLGRFSLLAFALLGCRTPVSTTEPSQREPVVEESEPSDSPELPVAFAYVTPGGGRSTGLPQIVDKGGPAWVAGASLIDDLPAELADAVERAEAIDPAVLERAGFGPPSPTLWLIDDEGACEAKIATPHVATYFDVGPTVEIAWRLEGCDPNRAWAPIGLFTVAPPERLRWIESAETFAEAVDPASFSGRAAPLLREFADGFEEERPDEYWLRELTIPDTDIQQIQVAALWRDHPGPGEEYEDCKESADIADWMGRWRESGFESFATGLEDEPWIEGVELIGAFVVDGNPRWLVASARMDAVVITPSAEPQTLVTGIHHDEVVASTGWSPAARCDP